jgi:peptidoglycan hydrolase-like protein with peptidoglycan-binding domain
MAILELGVVDPEVNQLQQRLKDLGFYKGMIGGTFDLETQRAVKAFQKTNGFKGKDIDGIVGPKTSAALNTAKTLSLSNLATSAQVLMLKELVADKGLVWQIQDKLRSLGLYGGGKLLDGDFGSRTRAGLIEFCNATGLTSMTLPEKFDRTFAQTLIDCKFIPQVLSSAKTNKSKILDEFQRVETSLGASANFPPGLAFLDREVDDSVYAQQVDSYPGRLEILPDGQDLVSLGDSITLTNSSQTVTFSPYPQRGAIATPIDEDGLKFLDAKIDVACVCIGSLVDGKMKAHWLGKNALEPVQFLSATKFIAILNVVEQAHKESSNNPSFSISDCIVRAIGTSSPAFKFQDLIIDITSYRGDDILRSNKAATMFKQFSTPTGLEKWIRDATGNNLTGSRKLVFQGSYSAVTGGEAIWDSPALFVDTSATKPLLSPKAEHNGSNFISAYDLTRLISMMGWHQYLPEESQLKDAKWNSLSSVIRGMGWDRSRYIDVAIETLGLENVISSPVILSKMGLGDSGLTYVALVQFVDEMPKMAGKPAKLRTLAMALRTPGTAHLDNDARMAAEVTEIIRRVVTEELA